MYEAAKMVSDSGLVLLHDAWRPYYSLSSTFFKTAVRVGHNLLVASNQGLGHLLEFFDVSEVGHPQQVNWVSE